MRGMKTLFFALAFVSFLVACSPQDPAVLTPAEKARFNRPRGGGNTGFSSSGGPTLPPQADAASVSFMLDRQSEIVRLIALGLQATQLAGSLKAAKCVQLAQFSEESSTRTILLDLSQCSQTSGNQTLKQNGRVTLKITLSEDGSVKRVQAASPEVDAAGISNLKTTVTKKGTRDSAVVRDHFEIDAIVTSKEPLTFQIIKAESRSKAEVSARPSPHSYEYLTKTTGQIQFAEMEDGEPVAIHSLRTQLRLDAAVQNGKTSYFDVLLTAEETREGLAANQETKLSSNCPMRNGRARLKFEYMPALSRQNDQVIYSADSVRLINEKESSRNTEIQLRSCKAAGALDGWFAIDWGQLFLF